MLLAALAQVNSVKVAESLEGPKRAAKDGPKKLWVHSDAQEVVNGLNGTSGIPWSRKDMWKPLNLRHDSSTLLNFLVLTRMQLFWHIFLVILGEYRMFPLSGS